jgi:laminin alpha 1/2
MSIELIDRKVRFAWDVGGGSSLVEHLLEIESAKDQSSEHDMWYRVVAQRYAKFYV